jgi:hypothetical protein
LQEESFSFPILQTCKVIETSRPFCEGENKHQKKINVFRDVSRLFDRPCDLVGFDERAQFTLRRRETVHSKNDWVS